LTSNSDILDDAGLKGSTSVIKIGDSDFSMSVGGVDGAESGSDIMISKRGPSTLTDVFRNVKVHKPVRGIKYDPR
jgi:hypothetical protein